MDVKNKFDLGQTVYVLNDEEQKARIVTSLVIMPRGLIQYNVSYVAESTSHYDFELTAEMDELKKVK